MTRPDKPADPAPRPDPAAAQTPDLTTLARLAGEWVEAVEAAAASILGAEVAVLNAVLVPEPPTNGLSAEEKAARDKADAAKTEESFDNLPI
jgi:hypothetical protein